MTKITKFRTTVPAGMRVFEDGIEVVGVDYRCSHARRFLKRSRRRIYLQREPSNKRDSNAIRVMGKSKGWFFEVQKCIGYVPADIATRLILTGMEHKVKAQLRLVSIEDRHSIRIRFDLLGPQDDYEKYNAMEQSAASCTTDHYDLQHIASA